MKVRTHLLRVTVTLVLVGLLFSQVGAGYFHNEHNAHRSTHILGAGHFAIQEHGEHCKLCSIDLIQLFSETTVQFFSAEIADTPFICLAPGIPVSFTDFTRGRAPPALS